MGPRTCRTSQRLRPSADVGDSFYLDNNSAEEMTWHSSPCSTTLVDDGVSRYESGDLSSLYSEDFNVEPEGRGYDIGLAEEDSDVYVGDQALL